MKILYFIDAPRPGGATNQLYTLLKHLDRDHFTPLVAFGDFSELNPWIEKLKKLGVPTLRTELTEFNSFRALKEFRRIYKSAKADLIHLQLCHSGSLRAAFPASRVSKAKLIVTEHDPFPLSHLKKQIKRFTLKFTKHTIAISEANRNFLSESYGIKGSKLTRIYNGVDLELFRPGTASKSEVLGLSHNDFVITTVTELHQRKGVVYLIKAMQKLRKDLPQAKLVIAGTGPKLGDYQKLVKKLELESNVKFLGFRNDVSAILQASDLFVLPSVREAFGLAVIEAMASRVPVIATNVGGLKEIVTSHTGILVSPKSSQQIAQSILKIKEDNSLRQDFTEKAYKRVKKEFSADTMTKATEALYEKVTSI